MMPVIRITDATWDRLKRWAEPLEDSPEDAVRKVLAAAEEHLKCRPSGQSPVAETRDGTNRTQKRFRKGLKTPLEAYRRPLLEALYEMGGSAAVDQALDSVEKRMKPILGDFDFQKIPSGGDVRWRNTAMWERFILVRDGLLRTNSPRGIWELSERGVQEVEALKGSGKP